MEEIIMVTKYNYDVCLSFAGEQRNFVQKVYEELKKNNVSVFYDKDEDIETMLWGRNLIEVFTDVYKKNARFCVMFISKDYAAKAWTNLERRRALTRALDDELYILPVRMDDTNLPGMDDSLSYLDASIKSPTEIAQQILLKLGKNITTITEEEAIHHLFCNIKDLLSSYNTEIAVIKGNHNSIRLFINQSACEAEEYGAIIQFYKLDILPYFQLINISFFPECEDILTENDILLLLEKVLKYHG